MHKLDELIISLYKVGGVKFGTFKLKSGLTSPVYFDLRVIVSYPSLLKLVSDLVGAEIEKFHDRKQIDIICGVPYTALPIATLVSVNHDIPMLLKRKEQKEYGTGNLIEGDFTPESNCMIIEDVISSGSSIIETAIALRDHGLKVNHAIVILDRGHGADINLETNGIRITSLITMEQMLEVLVKERLVEPKEREEVLKYILENQLFNRDFDRSLNVKYSQSLKCPVSQKLIQIMRKKRSNLCFSVDLDKWEDALEAVDLVGPKICVLKTHIDIFNLKGVKMITGFWQKLKALAKKHEFLIMEDRKFADIGSTLQKQLLSKPFEICEWADLVTVHGISGPGVLEAIKQLNLESRLGVVMIAEMSSEGNMCSPEYKDGIHKMATNYESIICGFVSQSSVGESKDELQLQHSYLQFTPGVTLLESESSTGDGLGQQYNSIEDAVLKRNADIIIVGRGILKNDKHKWVEVAEKFRSRGWEAFQNKIKY